MAGAGSRPVEESFRGAVFVAASLDGYIARADGAIDWLPDGGDEDHGFDAFFASVDAMVMGRNTYEQVLGFGAWPYSDKPVFVLTTRSVTLPSQPTARVEVREGPVEAVAAELVDLGHRHVYIDGGQTIHQFLDAGLVRTITVTWVPLLIGSGIPLIGPLARDTKVRHVGTSAFADGLVQSTYEVLDDR